MSSLNVNGITIEYDERGSGDPLLLVMGLGAQLIDWPEDFVDLLAAEGFRVIRFDNRDAGLSSEMEGVPPTMTRTAWYVVSRRKPQAPYLLADMATDAAALLDELGTGPAHVVGASMGGMIAQTMAIEHPDKVASLTSIMSNTGDGRNGRIHRKLIVKVARMKPATEENALERAVELSRLIAGWEFDEDAIRQMVAASLARSFRPHGAGRQTTAILASPDRTKALQDVTAPTLVIHGLADPLVQPSGGMATARAVPDSRLLMFPDMGHDLPRRRWPEVVAAIARNARRAGAPVAATN